MNRVDPRLTPEFDWSDIERIDKLTDELGREEIALSLASDLRASQRPRIIGVYGWWGSGKSFLLSLAIRQVFADNDADSHMRVVVAAFKAWRYEIEGDLAPGLIRCLYNIESQFGGRQKDYLDNTVAYKKVARRLLNVMMEAAPGFLVSDALATAVRRLTMAGTEILEQASRGELPGTPPCAADQIGNEMNTLVEELLRSAQSKEPNKEHRLVVFIDDLDRCSPENMVRMLEWLKVHLSVEKCTYVMALDQVAAARAIVGKYKQYLADERDVAYGFRYLEKLVDREYVSTFRTS